MNSAFRPLSKVCLGVAAVGAIGALNLKDAASADTKLSSVYLWGDNRSRLIAPEGDVIRLPTRVPYFDGKKLKDLALTSTAAAAVLINGNCVEWSSPTSVKHVSKGVTQVCAAGDAFVALANGSVIAWVPGSKPVTLKLKGKLGWFDRIEDIATGANHVVARTKHGKVFTGLIEKADKHSGQLGLASYPSFDPAPPPGELHEVCLLDEPVIQIASGNEHFLALTANRKVFGCGANGFGQLMIPYSYRTAALSVPTPVPGPRVSLPDSLRGCEISSVACGGNVSYLLANGSVFVAGDGEYGQFGTGSFSQTQVSPLAIPTLTGLTEYSESLRTLVPILPKELSVGQTHTFAKLSTGDWLVWGTGIRGQLGSGKLGRIVKPQLVKTLPIDKEIGPENTFVAGPEISACYLRS